MENLYKSSSIRKMSNVTKPICRSCRLSRSRSSAVRAFSASSLRGAIPPESPNYVDIPGTYQTDFFPPRKQKGILPVPREIFSAQQPDKPSQQYLSRAIPPRSASSKPIAKMSEEEKYKSRMTDLRRQHLRSGLLELYNRKVVMSQETGDRSKARQNERARLITQPPREDERLTNTSIPTSMRITPTNNTLHTHDHAARLAIIARKTANVIAHESRGSTSRLDALHTLYMNARAFITTEKQLAAEVDRVFDDTEPEWGNAANVGKSIWNREPPVTIAALLQELSTDGVGLKVHRGNTDRYRTDQKRMKRLAEVLSGGKM